MSVDRNAAYLAQQHRANIVISTSAMKVLADNHGPNFDKEWDIPVEVKSYLVTGRIFSFSSIHKQKHAKIDLTLLYFEILPNITNLITL